MELNDKLLEKAKNAKSAEELVTLAKENGIELTAEEAKTYFAKLNAKAGELADDELGDVAGGKKCGTIYHDGQPVITDLNSCEFFMDNDTKEKTPGGYCKDCFYFSTSLFLITCNNPKRHNN